MSLPLYLQISERLNREINAGLLPDGSRLPRETVMAEGFGVSVGTLRKALAELTSRGLLLRRQGSGNYVRRSALPTGIYAFFHLERPGGGGLPAASVLAVDRRVAPAGAGLPGPEAWRIRRLRSLDGAPAALEEIWIDARHAASLNSDDLPDSLYRYFADRFGLLIGRVEDAVGTGALPHWAPPNFPLSSGAPCGRVARRAFSRETRIEEVSTTWFDPAAAIYLARWKEESQ